MSEIDWKTELRKIEREFDGLPPEPSPLDLRTRREAERLIEHRKQDRTQALATGVRLLLVAALAAALFAWPYPRACGQGLFAYLGAESVIVVGGLWVAAWTWRCRMAKTHALAMALFLWGLVLVAAQVLPRVGYAKTDPAHPPQWWCAGGPPAWWVVR